MSEAARRPLLLDTHAWLWMVDGDERLNKARFRHLISETARETGIRVSVMSVWEVGMLEAKGRITFPTGLRTWVNQALGAPGLAIAPLTPEIAIESTRLAGHFHGDPVDRMLIATAKDLGATFVTADSQILSFLKRHRLPSFSI